MFYVKEYRSNGVLFNFTALYYEKEAVELATKIVAMYPEYIVKVTEMDFDAWGFPWEMKIWTNK